MNQQSRLKLSQIIFNNYNLIIVLVVVKLLHKLFISFESFEEKL